MVFLFFIKAHTGTLEYGHCIAFVTPEMDGQWVKFDDTRVTQCSRQEAINDNFGNGTHGLNAYMLFYVKEKKILKTSSLSMEEVTRDTILMPPTAKKPRIDEVNTVINR